MPSCQYWLDTWTGWNLVERSHTYQPDSLLRPLSPPLYVQPWFARAPKAIKRNIFFCFAAMRWFVVQWKSCRFVDAYRYHITFLRHCNISLVIIERTRHFLDASETIAYSTSGNIFATFVWSLAAHATSPGLIRSKNLVTLFLESISFFHQHHNIQ